MVGIMDKTAKAAKIRAEAGGGPLSTDQKSRLMDLFATHPASTTLHAKGGAVKPIPSTPDDLFEEALSIEDRNWSAKTKKLTPQGPTRFDTIHRGQTKSSTKFKRGGMVKGGCKSHVDWSK